MKSSFNGIDFDVSKICFISAIEELENPKTGKMGDTVFSFRLFFGGDSLTVSFDSEIDCKNYREKLVDNWKRS